MGSETVISLLLIAACMGLTVWCWRLTERSSELQFKLTATEGMLKAESQARYSAEAQLSDALQSNEHLREKLAQKDALPKTQKEKDAVIRAKSAQQVRFMTEAAWGTKPDIGNQTESEAN